MRDLTWIDDAHWLESFCDGTNGALEKPFLIDLNGEQWTAATDACRILAIKGDHGFKPLAEDLKEIVEKHVLSSLTAPADWLDIAPRRFDAFFEWDWDRKGIIGKVIIDREKIADSDALAELDLAWVQVYPEPDGKSVRFRGPDWLMAIAALNPENEYPTPRLDIAEGDDLEETP